MHSYVHTLGIKTVIAPFEDIFQIDSPYFGNCATFFTEASLAEAEKKYIELISEKAINETQPLFKDTIKLFLQAQEETTDPLTKEICQLRILQIQSSCHFKSIETQELNTSIKNILTLILKRIKPRDFFDYVYLVDNVSRAEADVIFSVCDQIPPAILRKVAEQNKTTDLQSLTTIFRIFHSDPAYHQKNKDEQLIDFAIKNDALHAVNILAQRTVHAFLPESLRYIEFRKILGKYAKSDFLVDFNLRRQISYIRSSEEALLWAKAIKEKKTTPPPSDLELFYTAEILFADYHKLSKAHPDILDRVQELYITISPQSDILAQLAKIRLLHILSLNTILTDQHMATLEKLKGNLISAMLKYITGPKELIRLLKDQETSRETRNQVMHVLWKNIELYDIDNRAYVLELLLSYHYIGQGNVENFVEKCELILPKTGLHARTIKSKLEFYTENKFEWMQRLFEVQNYLEAFRWLDYIMKPPFIIDEGQLSLLNKLALFTMPLPSNCKIILNNLRMHLFEYYLPSNHPLKYSLCKLIDIKLLPQQQQDIVTNAQIVFSQNEFDSLYAHTKNILTEIEKQWSDLRDPEEAYDALKLQLGLQSILTKIKDDGVTLKCSAVEKLALFKSLLSQVLADRWSSIQSDRLSYINNTESKINRICIALAQAIDPDHKFKILMPTLISEEDGYGNTLNEHKFGQFVLTEDKKYFISLKTLAENAIIRANKGEKGCQLLTTLLPNHHEPIALTRNDIQTISNLVPVTERFITICHRRLTAATLTALGAFQQLNTGLVNGDLFHSGIDDDAGPGANIAAVDFVAWFNQLPKEHQKTISSMTCAAGSFLVLLSRITKSEEAAKEQNLDGIYCVYSLATHFDCFIDENDKQLRKIELGKGNIRDELEWHETIKLYLQNIENPESIIKPAKSIIRHINKNKNHDLVTLCNIGRFLHAQNKFLMEPDFSQIISFYKKLQTEIKNTLNSFHKLSPCQLHERTTRIKTAFLTHLLLTRNVHESTRIELSAALAKSNDLAITREFTNSPYLHRNQKKLQFKLQSAKQGTAGYCISNGLLSVAIAAKDGIVTQNILVDYTRPMEPFCLKEGQRQQFFCSIKEAITQIKIRKALPKQLASLFSEFDAYIYHPRNTPELKSSLIRLRIKLVKQTFQELNANKTPQEILNNSSIKNIIDEVSTMVTDIHKAKSSVVRKHVIDHCKMRLHDQMTSRHFSKVLAAVFIAATMMVGGTLLGLAVGAVMGSYLGPGAFSTSFLGGLKAGMLASTWGIKAAATMTGVTLGGVGGYSFFRPKGVEKSLEDTITIISKPTAAGAA